MTGQIASEGSTLEGQVEVPHQKDHFFKNLDAALDFLKWVRPADVRVVSGRDSQGTYVVQVTIVNNSV